MILLHRKDISRYLGMDPRLDEALRLIKERTVENDALGRVDYSENMYYLVQHYETKPRQEVRWESHREYIDIQYVKNGTEWIDINIDGSGLESVEEPVGTDCIFYEDRTGELLGNANQIYLAAGMLAVFYPSDIHRPCICIEHPQPVDKIVFKIHTEK